MQYAITRGDINRGAFGSRVEEGRGGNAGYRLPGSCNLHQAVGVTGGIVGVRARGVSAVSDRCLVTGSLKRERWVPADQKLHHGTFQDHFVVK